MNRFLKVIVAIVIFSLCYSCPKTKIEKKYSFFVAGHAYGKPGEFEDNIGVHPPFKKKLDYLKSDSIIAFGVLTGDMIENGNIDEEWDELDDDLKYIGKKIYFAPGNHDVGTNYKREKFINRYGNTYVSFVHKEDLFITLDPNLDKWNISGEQLEWLKNVMSLEAPKAQNIFVFFHQVLWWEKDNAYKDFGLNSLSGRGNSINFWDEIYPLFESTNKNVFMFAGDVGVRKDSYMYHKRDKITLIASGMGDYKKDNFLVVNVENDSIQFDLIALNGDNINSLGKLQDYKLPQ
jgi:hypothetical protein